MLLIWIFSIWFSSISRFPNLKEIKSFFSSKLVSGFSFERIFTAKTPSSVAQAIPVKAI
jgi:hypothetical protein